MQHIIDRFISYVTVDTEADPNSNTTPSSTKQWNLANQLVEELKAIGLQDVSIDDKAYIQATLPSNIDEKVPTIGFVSHFDTTPDFTGANVKPQIVKNYDGGDIILNAEQNIVLSPSYFEDLLLYKGQTQITTECKTLLGTDHKAGISEIGPARRTTRSWPTAPRKGHRPSVAIAPPWSRPRESHRRPDTRPRRCLLCRPVARRAGTAGRGAGDRRHHGRADAVDKPRRGRRGTDRLSAGPAADRLGLSPRP